MIRSDPTRGSCTFAPSSPRPSKSNLILILASLLLLQGPSRRVGGGWVRDCPRHCHCRNITVDCSGAGLAKLATSFPSHTTRLTLDRNRLTRLPAGGLKGLSQLQYLSIQENNLTTLEEGALEGLDHLRVLILDNNSLRNLPEGFFLSTPRLTNLSLSGNAFSLRALNSSMATLRNLEGLTLRGNILDGDDQGFPEGFSELTHLRSLDLASNQGLRNLTEGFFSALAGLRVEEMAFTHCPLVTVHPESFSDLPHLTRLDLSDTTMPLETAQNLLNGLYNSSLQSLVFKYVFVYGQLHGHMNPDFWLPLRHTGLEELDMEGNYGGYLATLHNGLFRWVRQLRHLVLDHCHITTIARDTFRGLHKLRTLSLRHNFISCVLDCRFLTYSPLLRGLMTLDLSDNVLNNPAGGLSFRSDSFPRLRHLYLQNNRVSFLSGRMFELKTLRTLDLSGNPIHHIEPDTFRSLHGLEVLTITGSIYLQVLPNATFRGLRNLLHLVLNNNHLQSIHPRAFSGLHSLEVLEMNGNRIGGQTNYGDLHLTAKLGRLRRLDLGNNRLERFPVELLSHQPHLRVLLLHYNRISALDDTALTSLRQLETLDLSYNDVMEVSVSVLRGLPALRKLDLLGNPFYCTCQLQAFLRWVRTTHVQVPSVDELRCSGPSPLKGSKLLAYRPTAWQCHVKAVLLPLLSLLGVSVLAVGAAAAFHRCFCRRPGPGDLHRAAGDDSSGVSGGVGGVGAGGGGKDRGKGRNLGGWIRELLPVGADVTSPSGSEEGNAEEPLIEREHELSQETTCQESQTDENHIL